jgi:ABC-type Fe3+ transport system permease subunit
MESIATMILTILALLVIIIFVGSIYAFFYAIVTFIFSAGDPEKIKKAWNSIRYMILGVVMTLIVLFMFPIILKKAKVPGYEFYTASNIFSQVSFITG